MIENIGRKHSGIEDYENFYRTKEVFDPGDQKLITSNEWAARSMWVYDILTRHEGDSVLDIGCHTGVMSAPYVSKGYRVFGIEINPVAVEICKRVATTSPMEGGRYAIDESGEHIRLFSPEDLTKIIEKRGEIVAQDYSADIIYMAYKPKV